MVPVRPGLALNTRSMRVFPVSLFSRFTRLSALPVARPWGSEPGAIAGLPRLDAARITAVLGQIIGKSTRIML